MRYLEPMPVATRSGVIVREVEGRRDLDRFIKLPFRLYANEPRWIPPLISERRAFLDRRKNPYFDHAEAAYFLAERDGRAVGRISAQIDQRYNEFHDNHDGMFGFFECEDDADAAFVLLEAAAAWLAARGRDRMIGPMDFTTNDECGLLIEGHEWDPMVLQPWHHTYYGDLLERGGLEKEVDLLMWRLSMDEGLWKETEFHPMIHATAEKVTRDHGVRVRHMKKRNLEQELERFRDVYNSAWSENWGFVPVTEAEARFHAKYLKPVIDERWTFIAERDGEVLGAALSLPDVNQVLRKMNGRLLPFGWLKFLLGRPKIDRLRVFALGVKPQYQDLGVAAAFYVRHLEQGRPVTKMAEGEMGWILETNEAMNRAMEGMGGRVVKKYRIYRRSL